MAIKLQPREQAFIGIGSILTVVVVGIFGVVTDFAIMPSFGKFTEAQLKLTSTNVILQSNETEINSLNAQMEALKTNDIEMPEGKNIGEVNAAEGQTLNSVKTALLNNIIEMSQENNTNILISAKQLAKPAPPPEPTPPPVDPNDPNAVAAPPPFQISSVIEEAPYELKLRGNYTSLNDFVNTLAAYDTVVEIQKLEVTPEKEDSDINDPSRPLEATFNLNYLIRK